MEPTIRNPRIESAIGSENRSKLPSRQAIPKRRLPSSAPKFKSPGTEFLDAETGGQKIHPRDRNCRQRPGTLKIGHKIPAETASFRSTTVSAVREDWVVVCAVRREPVSLLFGQYQGDFQKKQRTDGRKFEKPLQRSHSSLIAPIRYQGGTGSAQFPQHRASIQRTGKGALGGLVWGTPRAGSAMVRPLALAG